MNPTNKSVFLELKKSNLPYRDELLEAISRVLHSGHYILGPEVDTFEKQFARYIGVSHCVGVGNGLNALELIFQALNFPENSEIIVPANTYIASILAVNHSGYIPIPVEPDPNTMNIDPAKIERAIGPSTKAILAVHLYGYPCDMERIREICDLHHLMLIEDAAQAHGGAFQGKKCGNLSDAAAFSFYPTKNLGAIGDAGAICTNNEQLANKIRTLGNYGSSSKNQFAVKGVNSRLDEIQAAILNVKLAHLDEELQKRQLLSNHYLHQINNEQIVLPQVENEYTHAWHLFVIRCAHRLKLIEWLEKHLIPAMIHYPIPPHKQNAYQEWSDLELPITEQIHNEVLSLPLAPYMQVDDLDEIIQTINTFDK